MTNPKRWPFGLQSSNAGDPQGIGEVIREFTDNNEVEEPEQPVEGYVGNTDLVGWHIHYIGQDINNVKEIET